MATTDYGNGISFTYRVLHAGSPTILRGEFYRDGDKTGDAIEATRPSMEQAVDGILSYARVVAAQIAERL